MDEPRLAPSAHKHGVSVETIRHAFNHPIRVQQLDDTLIMFIGPDHAGNLYEIGVVDTADGPLVVHAMIARPK